MVGRPQDHLQALAVIVSVDLLGIDADFFDPGGAAERG